MRAYRNQAGLQVPKKRRRRIIRRDSSQPMKATYSNAVWSYDFVHDACANGQKLKCLTVIDEYTKECLAIEVASAIRSHQVIEVLSRLMSGLEIVWKQGSLLKTGEITTTW